MAEPTPTPANPATDTPAAASPPPQTANKQPPEDEETLKALAEDIERDHIPHIGATG